MISDLNVMIVVDKGKRIANGAKYVTGINA